MVRKERGRKAVGRCPLRYQGKRCIRRGWHHVHEAPEGYLVWGTKPAADGWLPRVSGQ